MPTKKTKKIDDSALRAKPQRSRKSTAPKRAVKRISEKGAPSSAFSSSFVADQADAVLAHERVDLPVDQPAAIDFDLPIDAAMDRDGADQPHTDFDTFTARSEEVLTPANIPTHFVDGKASYHRKARVFWTSIVVVSVLVTVGWLSYLPFQLSQSFRGGEVVHQDSVKVLDRLSAAWMSFQSNVEQVGGILEEAQAQGDQPRVSDADQWPRAISGSMNVTVAYPSDWHVAYTENSIVVQDQPIISVTEVPAPGITRVTFTQHSNPEKLAANDWATRTEQITAPLSVAVINDRMVYTAQAGVNAVAYVASAPDRLLSVHATHANVAAFLPVWQDILDHMEIE